jgi:hypothetical protein
MERRKTMLLKARITTLVLFGCFASVAQAQFPPTPVTGNGDANFVAKFTGKKSIGNSKVAELDACVSQSAAALLTGDASIAALLCLRDPDPGNSTPKVTALASSPTDAAIWGLNNSPTGGDAVGVRGTSISADRGIGVRGQVENPQATDGIAVLGEANCPHCVAGLFNAIGGGDILVGTGFNAFTAFRVDAYGNVFANSYNVGGADFAESMDVAGDRNYYKPGDLLVIDVSGHRQVKLSDHVYSPLVAGIYSTKPGVLASQYKIDDPNLAKEVPLAIVGIVPCKVSAENGPIDVGDLLVTSSTPGHAMKGTDRSRMLGAVVGKALEPLREGKSVIQVLVTLQ